MKKPDKPAPYDAADRVLLYLKGHQTLGPKSGRGDDFVIASDASFAMMRKSSQAYTMKL